MGMETQSLIISEEEYYLVKGEMIGINNPDKEAQAILKKLEKGKASDASLSSLVNLIHSDPSMGPSILEEVNRILLGDNSESCNSAMSVLNMIAEKDPALIGNSIDAVIVSMKKWKQEYHVNWKLKTFEVLFKIYHTNPEEMGGAIPELFKCLENSSLKIRGNAYNLLYLLAATQSELFKGHSKYLVRALNGLYEEERIHACSLIKKIAQQNPTLIEDAYDTLEDFRLHHPHSKLRLESAHTLEMLKRRKKTGDMKHDNMTVAELGESTLDSVLEKMITTSLIKAITIVDRDGEVLAASGHTIDESVISKLLSMISSMEDAYIGSWVSNVCEHKKYIGFRASQKVIIVVMTAQNTTIGSTLIEINNSMKKIMELKRDFF